MTMFVGTTFTGDSDAIVKSFSTRFMIRIIFCGR